MSFLNFSVSDIGDDFFFTHSLIYLNESGIDKLVMAKLKIFGWLLPDYRINAVISLLGFPTYQVALLTGSSSHDHSFLDLLGTNRDHYRITVSSRIFVYPSCAW